MLVATVILIVYIIITVLLTATLILRAIDAGLDYEGERVYVDSNKYQVHVACVGNITETNGKRNPTILLSSISAPSPLNSAR